MSKDLLFTSLSVPNRRRILEIVAASPATVLKISEEMPITRQAVSQHLSHLKQASLVTNQKHGKTQIYSINREGIEQLRSWVDGLWFSALENIKSISEKNMTIDMQELTRPIEKNIEINASLEVVFDVFISDIGAWWPLERFSRSKGEPPKTVIIEASPGGAIYEVTADDTRLSWGEVKEIEPPHRILMDWHLGRPVTTTVEVNFKPQSNGSTILSIEHRGWEKLEDANATVERTGYDEGWQLILGGPFKAYAEKREVL
jgi:DNA-binding transcriptional ArsR family regulator